MKIGDVVNITDGSYMMAITEEGLSHSGNFNSTNIIGWCEDDFEILAKGGKYPAEDNIVTGNIQYNKIMIRNIVNGEIWFCRKYNIQKPELVVGTWYKDLNYEALCMYRGNDRGVGFGFLNKWNDAIVMNNSEDWELANTEEIEARITEAIKTKYLI